MSVCVILPKASAGAKPAGSGPVGPQQTALHHAGAEGGSAGEEPAEGPAYGGPGGTSAVQEVKRLNTGSRDTSSYVRFCCCFFFIKKIIIEV